MAGVQSDETIAPVRALESQSRVVETRTTGVKIVWHIWDPLQNKGDKDAGSGSKQVPLALFHGGSGSWTHWFRNIAALRDSGRKVIVPDLPGFGDSDALQLPDGGDADASAVHVAAALRELVGKNNVVDIVGFSFGGLIGGLVTDLEPSLVRRLVLVGAPAFGVRGPRPSLGKWKHLKDQAARDAVHRANLRVLMVAKDESVNDLGVRLHSDNQRRDRMRKRKLAGSDILLKKLSRARCRLDAIYGDSDALYRGKMKELSVILHSLPTLGRFIRIPKAGHWVQFEEAELFNKTLIEILKDEKLPASAPRPGIEKARL